MQNEIREVDLTKCLSQLPAGVGGLLVEHQGALVVAGGFVRSVVEGTPVADVDVFASGREDPDSAEELAQSCAVSLRRALDHHYYGAARGRASS